MNVTACVAALTCTAALAAGVAGTQGDSAATETPAAAETFGAPEQILLPGQKAPDAAVSVTAPTCDTVDFIDCHRAPEAAALTPGEVFVVPAPTGDPTKDMATLKAAVKDSRYSVIDGSSAGGRQVYAIKGMLEVNRTLTIRNLELKQLDTSKVVRTIYAAGGATPFTLRLENLRLERGPKDSGATGSVSDSAGIWTSGVTPEFRNIEVYGGGKGDGIMIHNASGGYLTDVYVHDIVWQPYAEDQNDADFWKNYTLAYLQAKGDWNGLTINDFDGKQLTKKRIEEQVNGIVLDTVTGLDIIRPRVQRLMTKFSDGQIYPYQTDGITINSGNRITIQDAVIDHVSEGIDVPGYPARAITIANAQVSDAPIFCFKTRGSYDTKPLAPLKEGEAVTIKSSTGKRCGMAAFSVAGGAEAWLQDTQAVDTGVGPDASANPGFGTVAAYRFFRSSSLPTADASSPTVGLHIRNATVANPTSKEMKIAFYSENDPADRRTFAAAETYLISNPAKPTVEVSRNFTAVTGGSTTDVIATASR